MLCYVVSLLSKIMWLVCNKYYGHLNLMACLWFMVNVWGQPIVWGARSTMLCSVAVEFSSCIPLSELPFE